MTGVAPAPGDVIEDYEILERVGGNMGLVFKARHRLLNRVVALKLLPAEWIADPARLARFQREIRALGQLEHPNLVTAADARSVDPWYLVAIEWIDGVDLHRLIKTDGALPVAVACEAARQAALGLHYAHEHGLIHRDVKPSNLMLTRSGIIKVIDFGLALTNEETSVQLTQTGLVLGTMSYCAPEQVRDASSVDIRADIYSLGCTLYHLLAGKAPYGQRKSFAEVVQAHLNEPFPSLAEARPDAPAGLETVLARMTAKDPNSRFATPAEVAEALEPFAKGVDLKRLVPASTQKDQHDPVPARKTPTPTPAKPKTTGAGEQRAKHLWTRRAALLTLVLASGGSGVLIVNSNRDPVVILMDTPAPKGVYDEENRTGATNAEELKKVLRHLPRGSLYAESISADWEGEARVLALRPHLVIIHRSSFFHPLNAKMGLGYPPFEDEVKSKQWEILYDFVDDKLITFIGLVGTLVPRTKFLVYSRGTDIKWTDASFREQLWPRRIESRFPELKGRITTMLIPGEQKGTFKDADTAEQIRGHVNTILGLPRTLESEKRP